MKFYEFFAGGGMARMGLGPEWDCLFANDFDPKKADNYRLAFGDAASHLVVGDIAKIKPAQLPAQADLAWASFPCQDLSLAGAGAGLAGKRSGVFWPFWRLMEKLHADGRAPKSIILENVYGAITSHGGKDLAAICEALHGQGYRFAPLVIDAAKFLPQSRPRLFVVAVHRNHPIPDWLTSQAPDPKWHPDALRLSRSLLKKTALDSWLWLTPPTPPKRKISLRDIVELKPTGVKWHTPEETQRLLAMMSPLNLEKVKTAKRVGKLVVGTIYKRTRLDEFGVKRQRAEVRFDDLAGCLRTPAGGSSRQIILTVEGSKVRSRLLSPREAARLMGLPDSYPLPSKYNDAYHLAGDGVAVPVVSWLARHVIEPTLTAVKKKIAA